MPPVSPCLRGLMWQVTMLMPSTMTLASLGTVAEHLALLALVLAGQDDNGIALFHIHSHFFKPSLHNFGSEGQDLHVILVAQLTGDGPKDTGAAGDSCRP